MPNYIEVLGNCFHEARAYTAGDPTNYNDLIWETTPLDQAVLDASSCAQGTFEPQVQVPPTSVGGYHDVITYGSNNRVKDTFLPNSVNNHTSLDSAPIALSSGEIVHATISTESTPSADFYVRVITNAFKGGAGTYAGGTQIGTDIEKVSGSLDHVSKNLTGFNFNAGDRLAVYLKKGITGGGEAREPVVRLFIRYD